MKPCSTRDLWYLFVAFSLKTSSAFASSNNTSPIKTSIPVGSTPKSIPTTSSTVSAKKSFSIEATIAITADNRRQRDATFSTQILPLWGKVLGQNTSELQFKVLSDNPWNPAHTPDGSTIRLIRYSLQSSATAPLDAAAQFQKLASAAHQPNIWAVPDTSGSIAVMSNAALNATAQPQKPASVAHQPKMSAVPDVSGSGLAVVGSVTPVIIPAGSFGININDTILIVADTRRVRDSVLMDKVRPLWQKILGSNVTKFELLPSKDSAWTTPQTSSGHNIRLIQYNLKGTSSKELDLKTAMNQFRTLAIAARDPAIWGVSDGKGGITILASETATNKTTPAPVQAPKTQ